MGQTGSSHAPAPAPGRGYPRSVLAHPSATLPHEPLRRAPKVLPSLDASPRLRCTDNGAILHSGGTISGRRAQSATLPPHSHAPPRHRNQHAGVYRSRSASSSEPPPADAPRAPRLPRERDPLHRSHTHLDLHDPLDPAVSKRFGSEPDLRNEEEVPKQRNIKNFRKKYKAPPPPSHQHNERDGSSPDSYGGNARNPPPRKLRLFKTRSETKQLISQTNGVTHSRSSDRKQTCKADLNMRSENQSLERRYKSPVKEKEQFVKYPDSKDRDMIQSSSSMRIEEHQLQGSRRNNDFRKCKNDKSSGYKSKANKNHENSDERKTPHLDRTFRYSERFKKESPDLPVLRREKSFDATLVAKERNEISPSESEHQHRIKLIGEQLKTRRLSPLSTKAGADHPLRKSLPSLLAYNTDEKDEFQAELKRATSRIRLDDNSNGVDARKLNREKKPSQKDRIIKCNRNKTPIKNAPNPNCKVNESSPKKICSKIIRKDSNGTNSVFNLDHRNEIRNSFLESQKKIEKHNALNKKLTLEVNRHAMSCVRESRGLTDRGQASGKESTPEQSPTRINDIDKNKENDSSMPSKQFYFGMIESNEVDVNKNVKDFPGLGSPIIEEFSNFHLIEKKLLGYHDKEVEVENFATRLQDNERQPKKALSSESALSSSEEEAGSAGSGESIGIALHLRPTLPKKQLEIPRFSPAAAWRQLAQIETEIDSHCITLDIKSSLSVEAPAESPHRSDKSGDKSGDSGISGDHAHSDERLDSPPRPHVSCEGNTWTPQQDLEGDSGSDGIGGAGTQDPSVGIRGDGLVTYSARGQPFSLSLPRDRQAGDKNKQFQQPFNSLQKLKKSVSGALGAALGSRRFDIEHEPILDDPPEQNWFLSKSAPNSLTNPFLYPHNSRGKGNHNGDIKEESTPPTSDQEDCGAATWSSSAGGTAACAGAAGGGGSGRNTSYLSWGGHVMYLPPAPSATQQGAVMPTGGATVVQHTAQPLSLLLTSHPERPTSLFCRSKSSGEIELRSRAARPPDSGEMRERERSASPTPAPAHPSLARAIPARVLSTTPSPPNQRGASGNNNASGAGGGSGGGSRTRGKRFTFQSTVRQLERRRIAERLSREADLKEQQRRTELEAMRRVEEEFQRKRAREKASIRQQLRLVSGSTSLPPAPLSHKQARDDPDGAVSARESPAPDGGGGGGGGSRKERREEDNRHSNASSEISARSKSTTPVRCVELSEWREGPAAAARQYRDWGAPAGSQPTHNIAHPPACYRMPKSPAPVYLNANGKEVVETFSGSPRSDNYRLEFARGVPRSPRTPRAPRHPLAPRTARAPHSPSSSSSELSASLGAGSHHRQAIRLRDSGHCGIAEPAIVPTLQTAPTAPPPRRTLGPPLTALAALR